MVLKFREYLQFHWDKDDFIIGKNVIGANGKPDQDQPTPRGRDWRLEKFFNNIIYEKEILCFCSFTLSTNPTKIRYQVSKTCSDKDFITFGNIWQVRPLFWQNISHRTLPNMFAAFVCDIEMFRQFLGGTMRQEVRIIREKD